jgi:hypothetical protein
MAIISTERIRIKKVGKMRKKLPGELKRPGRSNDQSSALIDRFRKDETSLAASRRCAALISAAFEFPPGRNLRFRRTPAASRHPPSRTGIPPQRPNAFQSSGKIDGNSVPGPLWAPSLHSRPSYQWSNEPRKRSQSGSHSRPHAPVGLKARAWLRHRIALQCSPGCLRSGFDSVKGKSNPA